MGRLRTFDEVRVRLREANTLYRHPNHNVVCHLVRASNTTLQLPLGASDVYMYVCTYIRIRYGGLVFFKASRPLMVTRFYIHALQLHILNVCDRIVSLTDSTLVQEIT